MFSSAKSSFFKALSLSIAPVPSFKYMSIYNTANVVKLFWVVNTPTVPQAASLPDIKDYLKKEIEKTITNKYSGNHSTPQLQSFYNHLIKQTQEKVAILDGCENEHDMQTLCKDKEFLDMLYQYLELNIYQDGEPVAWETIRAEISRYLGQNQVACQPGHRW